MNDRLFTFGKRSAAGAFAAALAFFGGATSCRAPKEPKWWETQPRPGYAALEKVGTFQGWFEVYKLLDGTYAIYEPYQFEETICYLVVGETRAVLVDSGMGIGNVREVVSALTPLPVTVIVTHEHFDHYGGAHRFDEIALYKDEASVRRLAKGVDNKTLKPHVTGDGVWKPLPPGFDPARWTIPSTQPATLLEDGAAVDLGSRTLEVLHTPGHTPGSLCLLDRKNRILFTGDHFYPGPLYLHSGDANLESYARSNAKLVGLLAEYDYVLGGHNEPWVKSEILSRVGSALDQILKGGGAFTEKSSVRRYSFQGFDILVRADALTR